MICWNTSTFLSGLCSFVVCFIGTWLLRSSSIRINEVPNGQLGSFVRVMSHTHENFKPNLPTISLPITEGRLNLWNKTKESFKWAHKNHLQDFDWFFKADDDTYSIMENMRYVLSYYNPDEPWYFGSRFKKYSRKGYMSGGGGYVLSRASLKMFVEVGLKDPAICAEGPQGSEDAEMGKCMSAMNVSYGDTRDQYNRWRFFPLDLGTFFAKDTIGRLTWFWEYIYYNISLSMDCCSDTAVTFHYESPHRMYFYHYMLYHMRAARSTSNTIFYLPKLIFKISNISMESII